MKSIYRKTLIDSIPGYTRGRLDSDTSDTREKQINQPR